MRWAIRKRSILASRSAISPLAARESGVDIYFHRANPGIPAPADTEYTASYLFAQQKSQKEQEAAHKHF